MDYVIQLVIKIIAALIAITLHEYMKAVVATALGDNTPKYQGRVTLNPIKHIDPIGLIVLILMGIGWAKPIETNISNFKDRKKSTVIVALTGIVTSLILAYLLTLVKVVWFINMGPIQMNYGYWKYIKLFIDIIRIYSVSIAVFNLIPLPPLTMSKLISIYSPRTYFKMVQYERIIQLIFLMLFFIGIIPAVIKPIIYGIINLYDKIFVLF